MSKYIGIKGDTAVVLESNSLLQLPKTFQLPKDLLLRVGAVYGISKCFEIWDGAIPLIIVSCNGRGELTQHELLKLGLSNFFSDERHRAGFVLTHRSRSLIIDLLLQY